MPQDYAPDRRGRPLYAVLIDADNIPAKYAEAVLKEVTSFGEPALRRVYADWSRPGLSAWADRILRQCRRAGVAVWIVPDRRAP